MDDHYSSRSDPEFQPTVPHIPRVPSPDDDPGGVTRPGSLPDELAATVPHGIPPVQPGEYAAPPPADTYYRQHVARERDRKRRVRARQRRGSEWAWVVVAAAIFGVTLVVSLSLFVVLHSVRSAEVVGDPPAGMVEARSTAVVIVPTAVNNLQMNPAAGDSAGGDSAGTNPDAEALANIQIEPWDGQERFTMLVMGWDRRPGDPADAAYRTDTMMLVSIDPQTQSIGVLSIPRDLYVNIPGYSELQRVNSAFVLGELRQPGYGPQLTMQTVMYNLGIRVNDYVIVDFNAFTTLVDTIGGIDVDVPYNISDPQYPDMYYGYDPFYITAGMHHLDGETALKYARTRHGSSDFRRAERQQQVIFAIRDRILNLENLPQIVLNAPTLWANVQDNVRTGLAFDQMMRLAWYVKDIPTENIHTGVIDEQYISFYTTPSGASVVIPNRYRIGPLMVEIFGESYNQ